MKDRLGKGILLLLAFYLLPLTLYAQELTNKEIKDKMAEAQSYFDNKDYDSAIKILTDIVENNPERLDQAVDLMDKIKAIRNQYNKKYEELIQALYVDEKPDEALEIIAEMEQIEPKPNKVNAQAIRNARIAAELVYNKIALRELMDKAKIQLDQKNYGTALEIYKTGFDLGRQTFEESEIVSDLGKKAVARSINEVYQDAVKIVSDGTDLASRITKFKSDAAGLPPAQIDRALNGFIDELSSLSEKRQEFIKKCSVIGENLNVITEVNDKAPERFFLDFAGFLFYGRNESEYSEGVISTTDFFWEDRFDNLAESIDSLMNRSYNTALASYQSGELEKAGREFGDTLTYARASISLYNLIHDRITLGTDLQPTKYSLSLIDKYYGKLVDSRVFARATDIYQKMIALRQGFNRYSLEGDQSIEELYSLRKSIDSDIPVLDDEKSLWNTINSSLDWLSPLKALSTRSGGVTKQVETDLTGLKAEMEKISLAILTKLTDSEYKRISDSFSGCKKDLSGYRELLDGVVDSDVAAYTGNNELKSVFPDRALPGLVDLSERIGKLKSDTASIIDTFSSAEKEEGENTKITEFLQKVRAIIPEINDLDTERSNLESLARDDIFKAEGFANQGNKLLDTVREIADNPRATRESYDRARVSLKDAGNAYFQSFSLRENLDLRKKADRDMAALQQALIDGENRLVVTDVRNLINQGKKAYLNRQYTQARVYLEQARNRWLTTNTEEHPEIQYWTALVDLALQFDRGRTINPTQPLYDEMTQYLNLAYSDFNKGVNLMARGERDAAVEVFNQAISNIENVEIHMPRNEAASLLRLKIAQLIDPVQFRDSFSQRIDSAWSKLQSSDRTKQGEGYNELIDLSKIDANYPGLKSKITTAEYDILKTKKRPPDPASVAESNDLFKKAKAIVDSGNRNEFELALTYLTKAIELNPDNNAAISLKDDVQINTGGQTTLVLPTALLNQFNEASKLFEQGKFLDAWSIIQELKKDSRSAKYPELLKLEERTKLKLGIQ